jgi:hypothetical protein
MTHASLIQSLQGVRRRVRLLTALFGIGLLATCCIGLLLLLVGTDYVLNLHPLPRLFLILAALGAAGYALWYWTIRSMLSRLTLNDIAGRIEQAFPQYQDRLRSTVDILSNRELPGSAVMKERVVSEATRLTQTLDLRQAVVFRPVVYTTTAGLSALLLLVILLVTVQHDYVQIACDRLLTPFSANPWPKQVVIDQVGTLPDRVPVGGKLDMSIRLSRGQSETRKAIVYYQYGDETGSHFGPVQQEYMTRDRDGVYHASIDARTPAGMAAGLLKVWTESGDGRRDFHLVKVVQRLAISRLEAIITAPPYSHLPTVRVNLAQNPVTMTLGSKLELRAVFNKPLDSAKPVRVELLTPDAKPQFAWQPPVGPSVTATVNATESFRFRLHATDVDGFTNTAAEEFECVVKPDQLPTVVIEKPRADEDRTAVSVIPLQALAEDDFGIQELTLSVDRVSTKTHWDIPLVRDAAAVDGTQWAAVDSTNELQRFRANYAWDLSQLKDAHLQPGDTLEYGVIVKDNFQLNGATHPAVASGKMRIVIISQEELTTKVIDGLTAAAEQAKALKQSQETTQQQTSNLSREIAAKPQMDEADKSAAEQLSAQQSNIASQTKSLGQTLADLQSRMEQNKSENQELKSTVREVGDLLNSTAENSMKNAAGALDVIRNPADKADRDKAIQDAQTNQAASTDALQRALDRMGNVGSLSKAMQNIQQMLAAQQKLSADTAAAGKSTLGQSRDQLTPQQRKKLDDLSQQQKDLATRSAQMLKDMARDASKLAKSDPVAAAAMKQAAETAKAENVAGNQDNASKAVQQNQQSEAGEAQKQAEEGMSKMLNDLHQAEKQKLQELAEKLADLQQQLALLIGQQAGHNLDNLNLQGGDVLAAVDSTIRADLFNQAQRDPNVPMPPIEVGLLISMQDQTEHNARDLVSAIQDLPKGADAANQLTDAADQMMRATVNLRQGKLAEAYDPSQVEALAALVRIKKEIDAQKDDVDQKNDDQKKDSIREGYTALLAEQKELIARTSQLDGTPKEDDGSLSRRAALQLSQISFDQGKLADTAEKMDPDLATLGSIVYSFANRDIVKNMRGVKEQLSNQQTGAVTQGLQQQVAGELEAMIRDLTVKPRDKKTKKDSKPPSGDGGGSMPPPPPSMPSEAEFRLIKDMQLSVNDSTLMMSRQPAVDKTMLVSLAQRQEDLRHLLDQLIHKATQGKAHLRPEPEPRDLLPEELHPEIPEATTQNAANAPDGSPDADAAKKDLNLVGDRMARVRQRVSLNSDLGPTTLEIEKRIVRNLDQLIEISRQDPPPPPPPSKPKKPTTQPKPKPKPQPSSGVQPDDNKPKPKPMGVPSNKPGSVPNGESARKPESDENVTKQEAGMWGAVTPRQRDAVIESQSEKVLDKYKNMVEDYYQSMSSNGDGH